MALALAQAGSDVLIVQVSSFSVHLFLSPLTAVSRETKAIPKLVMTSGSLVDDARLSSAIWRMQKVSSL